MNLVEATTRACEESTLLEALTFICIWETERVVRQARANDQWETCFGICLQHVTEEYWKKNDRRTNTR